MKAEDLMRWLEKTAFPGKNFEQEGGLPPGSYQQPTLNPY